MFFEGKLDRMFIYHQQTGTKYYGNSNSDLKYHGSGTLYFAPEQKANRYKYRGNFVNGQKEGFGIEERKNSNYSGLWKNDLKHGHGI